MKFKAFKEVVNKNTKRYSFLVLLYGCLVYDGRVQRMLEVLNSLGDVTLIGIGEKESTLIYRTEGIKFINVHLPNRANKVIKHFIFWWAVFQAARREMPSVVVSEDYFTTFIGLITAKYCKSKLIYDAHELIIPEPDKPMNNRNMLWYFAEKICVKKADLVIAANEDRARLMQAHYKLIDRPVVMRNIPAQSDGSKEQELVQNRFPELIRKNSAERLILYQGHVSLTRGIDRFIEALDYLPDYYRLVVAGGGSDIEQLKSLGRKQIENDRLTILGQVENMLLPAITAMADVGLVTYPFKGLNNIYCAPNKIFEYTQAGLPIVATDQPPLSSLVKKYGIGKLFGEKDSPEIIAKLIRDVVENKKAYKEQLYLFNNDHQWECEKEKIKVAISGMSTERERTI